MVHGKHRRFSTKKNAAALLEQRYGKAFQINLKTRVSKWN
jgi:hypothetical protein